MSHASHSLSDSRLTHTCSVRDPVRSEGDYGRQNFREASRSVAQLLSCWAHSSFVVVAVSCVALVTTSCIPNNGDVIDQDVTADVGAVDIQDIDIQPINPASVDCELVRQRVAELEKEPGSPVLDRVAAAQLIENEYPHASVPLLIDASGSHPATTRDTRTKYARGQRASRPRWSTGALRPTHARSCDARLLRRPPGVALARERRNRRKATPD